MDYYLNGAPRRSMSRQNEDAIFQRGIEQFNAGLFFETHETWEEIWLAAPEPERTFLQGMIQVAAAFHHYRRGNRAGALSLLTAALEKLRPFPDGHRGLRLDELRAVAERWVEALGKGEDLGAAAIPRLRRYDEPTAPRR